MKVFLVNVNNCLNFSLYEPFFFEEENKGNLEIFSIEDISQICQLKEKIENELNNNGGFYNQIFIAVLVSRDLKVATPSWYQFYTKVFLYTQINRYFKNSIKFNVFYLNSVDELGSDREFRLIQQVDDSLISNKNDICSYSLPNDFDKDIFSSDNKSKINMYFSRVIKDETFRSFYISVAEDYHYNLYLNGTPNSSIDNIFSQFIAYCKGLINHNVHIYDITYRYNDSNNEKGKCLKLIYYLLFISEYTNYDKSPISFDDFDFDIQVVKDTIKTYIKRLNSMNFQDELSINVNISKDKYLPFNIVSSPDGFSNKINEIEKDKLSNLEVNNVYTEESVDSIFTKIKEIIVSANKELLQFGKRAVEKYKEPSRIVFDSNHEIPADKLYKSDDLDMENNLFIKISNFSNVTLPGFNEEYTLTQELKIISERIKGIISNLRKCKLASFLCTLLVSIFLVSGVYFFVQNSVFFSENTLYIFVLYTLLILISFPISFFIVKNKYKKEISFLLLQCKEKVSSYLYNYIVIATDYENNLNAMGECYVEKDFNNKIKEALLEYEKREKCLLHHQNKIESLKTNFKEFDSFLFDVQGKKENKHFTIKDLDDQDYKKCEFYYMKCF